MALETDETGRKYLKFDFDHAEAKKIKDVSCPLCGGDIVQTPFGYGCANYKKMIRKAAVFPLERWEKKR